MITSAANSPRVVVSVYFGLSGAAHALQLGPADDRDARRGRELGQDAAQLVAVEVPLAGRVQRTVEAVVREVGHQPRELLRADHPRPRQPVFLLEADGRVERLGQLGRLGRAQEADPPQHEAVVGRQLLEPLDPPRAQLDVLAVDVLTRVDAGRDARRSAPGARRSSTVMSRSSASDSSAAHAIPSTPAPMITTRLLMR